MSEVYRGPFGRVSDFRPEVRPLDVARRELLGLGVTVDQLEATTGMGLRSGVHCAPTDTVLRKYAAGALSAHGVMGVLFGSGSWQHHAGHNLERPERKPIVRYRVAQSPAYHGRWVVQRWYPDVEVWADVGDPVDSLAVAHLKLERAQAGVE